MITEATWKEQHISAPCQCGIECTPYDVLIEILSLLPASDVVHLLSASRTLRSFYKEEQIWRGLSRPFGVTDVSFFGGRSFYTVYSALLHKYGPLLGLWAGDHAFTGHILEFRLDKGNNNRGARIVGEFWRFRRPLIFQMDIDRPPEDPRYISAVRIGFADAPASDSDHAADTVHIVCSAPTCGDRTAGHHGYIHHVERTTNGIFLGGDHFMSLIQHPNFPASHDAAWIDRQRPPLPLTPISAPTPISRPLGSLSRFFGAAWQFVMSVHLGNTAVEKPRAISISCASDCVELEYPTLSMRVDNSVTPRYYPLRDEVQQGFDCHADEWTPDSLVGLWLGWYGPHGTECLFVDYDKDKKILRGLKITGDENVPRGVPSWEVFTHSPCQLTTEEGMLCARVLGERSSCTIYRGKGTTSDAGFL